MRDDGALVDSLSAPRFYDPGAPLDKALPEAIAEHGLKRLPDHPPVDARQASLVPILLDHLGISAADYAAAGAAARRNGTDAASELVAAKRATEDEVAHAMACVLGLERIRLSPGDRIVGRESEGATPSASAHRRVMRTCDAELSTRILVAPRIETLDETRRILAAHRHRRWQAAVVTPSDIARHRAAASAPSRARAACLGLSADRPELSARHILTGLQGMAVASLLMAAVITGLFLPGTLLDALHFIALPVFFGCVLMRVRAVASLLGRPTSAVADAMADAAPAGPHPTYSVLVALYREKDVAAELVAALARLEWPRSKLEVMLVCEGDDPETIAAVEAAIANEPGFEIVVVPPSLPRTKPKALNFALPLASGEFLVLYDAEDRPRPDQLASAYARFRREDARLACLQAPLVVQNGADNWLAGHFALEYAALFRGFLPWLAKMGLPLPLGGTSNHFRREALVAVGGWDSHNVTEDADLGIRLCRAGYRIGTIEAPTYEDAPERWRDWRNQRTRWMKGWMQTWLVHTRDPVRLWRDLGAAGFVAFHLLFFGMIASALAHPFFLLFLAATLWSIASAGPPDALTSAVIAADLVNLVLGYLAFTVLAMTTLDASERRRLPRRLWSLHLYWLLVSLASMRAFLHLMRAPHQWEKTPHGPSARAEAPARPAAEPIRVTSAPPRTTA